MTVDDESDRSEFRKCAAVLPWLSLNEQVSVGPVTFMPFDLDDPPLLEDPRTVAMLVRRLSSYKDLERRPISRCTVALHSATVPLAPLSNNQKEDLSRATDALCFAMLAENQFFADSFARYTNSSRFTLSFMNFEMNSEIMAFRVSRIGGEELSAWGCDDISVTIPLQCAITRTLGWRDNGQHSLLRALWKAIGDKQGQTGHIASAVSLFSWASSDEQWLRSEQQVPMFESAFEYCFPDIASNFSGRLDTVVRRMPAPGGGLHQTPLRVRPGTWLAEKACVPPQSRCVLYWFREFVRLRNDILHGNPLQDRSWVWHPEEHVVMAAFSFPLLIKCLLAEQSVYSLTEADKIRLDAIDHLLYMAGRWWDHSDTHHGLSNWSCVFEKVKEDRRLSAMADFLREAEDEQ